ncbi:hypothetical protein Hc94105_1304 [Helicobacter cinaedi]|uniref:FkbM family methyltransferase n=1 Tax=Helicobacter cinaedi TaxID=213 RepID=UPI001EED8F46|nr:FkbM family methyltransferase [Helicobacter cinaedi]BDB67093.1 hypothetical protein Hc94105_1304 [Helicobacter cinaedi]
MIFSLVKDEYVIFDVGGNIGWYSIALAKAKRNLIIHAFEPIPSTYEQFVANAQYNGVQITINNCALFDKQCDLKFYVYEQDFGNASATIMHEEKDNKEIICKTTTLDMYAKEQNLTRLDFIKCDIEGAEFFALKGGLKTLEQYKPILFVEMLRKWAGKYNYHPNDIIDLLGSLGYMCYFVCHRESTLKLTRLEKMTEETRETNFFFLHKEKHKSQIENFVL